MNRNSSKSSRVLSTARGYSDWELVAENKRLREQMIHLKNINLAYAGLLSKIYQSLYSDASDFNSRERKMANISEFQNQTIYKLKEQLRLHKGLEEEYLALNNYIKNKPYRSVLDFIKAYETLTGDVSKKKDFINSLEGTIGNLKKELEDQSQIAKLRRKVNELQDRNTKSEVKCQKLMHEMQQTIKSNNQLRVQSYNTEIKLRELELKDKRSARLSKRASTVHINKQINKQNRCQNRKGCK